MIETWDSAEDLKRHSESEHVKMFQNSQKNNVTAVVKSFSPVKL